MLSPFHDIQKLCLTVTRGVIRSDVVTPDKIDVAVDVIREEVKGLLNGSTEEYEEARAAVIDKTVHANVAIGLVVVNAVRRIRTGA